MKTSVIEVRDMLSVLSVLGVEKRIGEVPGVESVTVNYAAGSATVRYNETRQVTVPLVEPTIFRDVCHD
jgi:Cu2+-exporting ATPase